MCSQTFEKLDKPIRIYQGISLSLWEKNLCSSACCISKRCWKIISLSKKIFSFMKNLITFPFNERLFCQYPMNIMILDTKIISPHLEISQQLLNVCYSSSVLLPSDKLLSFLKLKKSRVLLKAWRALIQKKQLRDDSI